MKDPSICPCQGFVHPIAISNPPGLSSIQYRAGDFLQFREALLKGLAGETELNNWKPTAKGDLALQMVEWWAYIADVLTFYNERAANEAYLRTAVLPGDIKRLIRLLGYRPRPGIGATGTLAALLSGPKSVIIPRGFPILSKPGPGKQPQTFETDASVTVTAPDSTPADATANLSITNSLLLKGKVTSIAPGDPVLLRLLSNPSKFAMSTVVSLKGETGAGGKTNTRVSLSTVPALPAGTTLTDCRLQRATQSLGLWSFPADANLVVNTTTATMQLASIARQIRANDPLLLNSEGSFVAVAVIGYSEIVWYANPAVPAHPETSPDPKISVPIPHAQVVVSSLSAGVTEVRFAFQDAGEIVAVPATKVATALTPSGPAPFRSGLDGARLLLEDSIGNGELVIGSTGSPATTLTLTTKPVSPLIPPVKVLYNLLPVSRGKTVPSELLGTGDATIPGQEFVLHKSPLTYLASSAQDGYRSTLTVMVDQVRWTEAPSFFAQPADAQIYVLREDENSKTHVQFGDGVNGSRLPSGASIVAGYRFGSGSESPAAGELSVITQPLPNLKGLRNPVAVGGGADPDAAGRIRQLAPRSVLTFGRAVSADDYSVLAAQTPGVARARAYWSFDAASQRTLVTLYAGDDSNSVTAAKQAIARAADPNRPVVVLQALPLPVRLTLTVQRDANIAEASVTAGIVNALLDPDSGLFGANAVQIGKTVFRSEIYDAVLKVKGAVAVHALEFAVLFPGTTLPLPEPGYRHFPGEGGFYTLSPDRLKLTLEVLNNAG